MAEIFNTDDIYTCNADLLKQLNIAESIKSIEDDIGMMDSLSNLFFDKSFVLIDSDVINLSNLFQSVQLTLYSALECFKHFCIADTYTLIRKYKDDLFFYLYILVYSTEKGDYFNKSKRNNKEDRIKDWTHNKLHDFNSSLMLKEIGESPIVREAVAKYNLRHIFIENNKKFDNYVHSNGADFLNCLLTKKICDHKYIKEQLHNIPCVINCITASFTFLLILCVPHYISSSDYIDSFESGQTPIDGSQYFVAPFVVEYLKKHLDVLDSSCYQYLKDNTTMLF